MAEGLNSNTPTVTVHGITMDETFVEISGFGGGYEECCRRMALTGYKWLCDNPDKDPKVAHYRNFAGIDKNINSDAEEFENAVLAAEMASGNSAMDDGATGAMVQYSKAHALIMKKRGWESYAEESKRRKSEESESAIAATPGGVTATAPESGSAGGAK